MNQPLLSVCIITYNHENYIRQCLDSVMMQKTNFDFEVVIGEDCSTDNTRAIVMEFEQKHPDIIKPIYHEQNVGALRNAYEFCYPKATGAFIACLEGDDYWTVPDKLQRQVDFLQNNPDCSFCFHSINAVNEKDQIIEEGLPSKGIIIYKPKEIFHLKITTLSVVFRNCITLTSQELVSMNVSDYILFAILSNYGGAANLGFVGGHYRRHAEGLFTGLNKIQRFKYSLSLLKQMKNFSVFSRDQKKEIDREIFIRKKRYIKDLIENMDIVNSVRIAFI